MSQPTLPLERTDELLSEFFKSKLPHPWPAAPVPARAQPAALRASSGAHRARFSLAASIALLLGVGLYLASGSKPGNRGNSRPAITPPGILNDGSAKMPKEFDKLKKPSPMLK